MDTNQLVNEKQPENERNDSEPLFDSSTYLDMASKVLSEGSIEVLGRMPYSSNATLLTEVTLDDQKVSAIYKPVKGEQPLWDFPAGLHRREIAAFILSKNLGWGIIPPTVERDGPFGIGSLQLFIETDYQEHHFTLVDDSTHHDQLKKMCVFDLIANNTDRKSGHCLISHWGQIYGIDQGLCFSEDFKLRTVIWDFAGEAISDDLLKSIQLAIEKYFIFLDSWLTVTEINAMTERSRWLLSNPVFPSDDGHRWPWPLV
jgi:uncharacterized repeat protein (TIGR03843 family)